jgi:hypothetical protein
MAISYLLDHPINLVPYIWLPIHWMLEGGLVYVVLVIFIVRFTTNHTVRRQAHSSSKHVLVCLDLLHAVYYKTSTNG